MRYEEPEVEEMGEASESVKVILTMNPLDWELSTGHWYYADPTPWWPPW